MPTQNHHSVLGPEDHALAEVLLYKKLQGLKTQALCHSDREYKCCDITEAAMQQMLREYSQWAELAAITGANRAKANMTTVLGWVIAHYNKTDEWLFPRLWFHTVHVLC